MPRGEDGHLPTGLQAPTRPPITGGFFRAPVPPTTRAPHYRLPKLGYPGRAPRTVGVWVAAPRPHLTRRGDQLALPPSPWSIQREGHSGRRHGTSEGKRSPPAVEPTDPAEPEPRVNPRVAPAIARPGAPGRVSHGTRAAHAPPSRPRPRIHSERPGNGPARRVRYTGVPAARPLCSRTADALLRDIFPRRNAHRSTKTRAPGPASKASERPGGRPDPMHRR